MLAQANGTAQHYGATSACGAGTAQGILLVKDANGIFAMSASCLHLGGQVQASSGGFSCPCHGSTYDANGTVTGGPAPVGATLQHYLVRESTPGGTLEVDTTSQVAPSTRLS
jgi:Rieske Fe-S protein